MIDDSDWLDGRDVDAMIITDESLDGNMLAFIAQFADGSQSIYIATIPELSTALLLAFGLIGLAAGRRRR